MAEFVPSQYQIAIRDWVQSSRGSAFVAAVAGSGKTTVLVWLASMLSGAAVFMAFSSKIQKELRERLSGTAMEVYGIYGMGLSALKRSGKLRAHKGVNSGKYYNICRNIVDGLLAGGPLAGVAELTDAQHDALKEEYPVKDINDLCQLCQVELVNSREESEILAVVQHHGKDFHPDIVPLLKPIIRQMMQTGFVNSELTDPPDARPRECVCGYSFVDMIWLPWVYSKSKRPLRFRQFAWIFVDEAQDLSNAQRWIVQQVRSPGGRFLFVGDRQQAIFGFAGADCTSVDKIVEEFGCIELPLSVCYRCPLSHLELARKFVPQIEARDGASEGTIENFTDEKFLAQVREGDLISCRLTAPLVKICYQLIATGISAAVLGRDIGAGLVKVVKAIQKKERVFKNFLTALAIYEASQRAKIEENESNPQAKLDALEDKIDCVRMMHEIVNPRGYDAMIESLESIFVNDDAKPSVTLATIHRIKGLETKRHYIINPSLMPFRAETDWQLEQERNLEYVSLTRSTDYLGLVELPRPIKTR